MPVIINEFEVVPQPPPENPATAARAEAPPVRAVVRETVRIIRRERERQFRVQAH
jgi:hypothetical protein